MKKAMTRALLTALAVLGLTTTGLAAASAEVQAKIEAKAKQLQWISTDPKVVAAVKEYNANPPAEAKAMSQDKWKGLQVLDPFVRSLSKNALAEYLKGKKDESWAELFVSGADGTKAALFSKSSNWSHKGKEKHDLPMKGKTYIGPVEMDASSGVEEAQVGLPVLDAGKPIGSVVVGLAVNKLK
jgi:hypothetical protein